MPATLLQAPNTDTPEVFHVPLDRAQFRRVPSRPGVELYKAHIVHHAFEPHTHEAFGLGAIASGVERFRYGGADHLAPPNSLVLMNPDELHTGRAETAGGWRYRMLYIDPAVLADLTGEPVWWFTDAVVSNSQAQAQRVSQLLEALWQADEPLAFDSLLHSLVAELRPHARVAKPQASDKRMRFEPVLDYLHAHYEQRLTLDDLAGVAGLSPFHFLRQFQAQHHVTPQQMLMAVRLFEAKRLLAAGQAPAMVAASTGLTDQAHLTRAFARRYGVTPARYQQQLGLK